MPRLGIRPRAVLFDLDGTLTDPAPGITRCLAHALTAIDVPVPSYDQLLLAIGPPWETYLTTLGVPAERVGEALTHYRAEYEDGGLYEATVYGGIHSLLAELQDDGFEIALATSKPINTASRVIEHFGLAGYFTFLGGATLDGSRSHKHDVISHVLDTLGHADAVMVGDRKYDIEGARHHGLPCVAVTWGHADNGEIASHDPAATVESPGELGALLRHLPREASADFTLS
jgi:phosphoglycolate phosphatase